MPLGMTPSRHPQLFLHLSNRLEHLADQLADDLFGSKNEFVSQFLNADVRGPLAMD